MALPSQQEIILPGGGAVVGTVLPDGDYAVTVGSSTIDVSAGWAAGASIVAPLALPAGKFAVYERRQPGGAGTVYLSSDAAGTALLILEELPV